MIGLNRRGRVANIYMLKISQCRVQHSYLARFTIDYNHVEFVYSRDEKHHRK